MTQRIKIIALGNDIRLTLQALAVDLIYNFVGCISALLVFFLQKLEYSFVTQFIGVVFGRAVFLQTHTRTPHAHIIFSLY